MRSALDSSDQPDLDLALSRGRGADLKELLRRHEVDTDGADDLTEVRDLLALEDRG